MTSDVGHMPVGVSQALAVGLFFSVATMPPQKAIFGVQKALHVSGIYFIQSL